MGLDLEFVRKDKTQPMPPEPEGYDFSARYTFRHKWLGTLWTIETDSIRECDCPTGEKHQYGCCEPEAHRPKDFAEFRAKLGDMLNLSECAAMTDYFEQNPNLYVTFSN